MVDSHPDFHKPEQSARSPCLAQMIKTKYRSFSTAPSPQNTSTTFVRLFISLANRSSWFVV
jgi:hypothetical protein